MSSLLQKRQKPEEQVKGWRRLIGDTAVAIDDTAAAHCREGRETLAAVRNAQFKGKDFTNKSSFAGCILACWLGLMILYPLQLCGGMAAQMGALKQGAGVKAYRI